MSSQPKGTAGEGNLLPAKTKAHISCKYGENCLNKNSCLFSHDSIVFSNPKPQKKYKCNLTPTDVSQFNDLNPHLDKGDSKGPKKHHNSVHNVDTNADKVTSKDHKKQSKSTIKTLACNFGNNCTKQGCTFTHPDESIRLNNQCHFGSNCTLAECKFDHSLTTTTTTTTPATKIKTDSININNVNQDVVSKSSIKQPFINKKTQPDATTRNQCLSGSSCTKVGCKFDHPSTSTATSNKIDTNTPAPPSNNKELISKHANKPSKTKQCFSGSNCTKVGCEFTHPLTSATTPLSTATASTNAAFSEDALTFFAHSNAQNNKYKIVTELTDLHDKEIHSYLLQTYEFQKLLNCFKLIVFQEVTSEFSIPLVKKLSSLSARIHQIIDGYLFLYQNAKNANQSHYSTTISHKLKYIHQTIEQFRNDMNIIFTTLMPHWKNILSVVDQFHASQNNLAIFASNDITNLDLQQQVIDDTWLVAQLSSVSPDENNINGSKNAKSVKKKQGKGGKSKLERLTVAQFASLVEFENDLATANEDIVVHSVPTYSSTVFTQIETFIGVMATYFDSIDFLFTAPLAAFQLLTTIFQQESSYKVSIINTSTDIQSFLREVEQNHIECEADSNERDTPDVRLDPEQSYFAPEETPLVIIDHEAKENDLVEQALGNTIDPNLFRADSSQQKNTSPEDLAASILKLIGPQKALNKKRAELQLKRANPKKKSSKSNPGNDSNDTDIDFSQKTLPSDCFVEIKALPVLLSMGTFFTSTKDRLITCSSTGSGKSVLLPLIEVLLSYYDTSSLYYAFSTSAQNISLPPNYLSSQLPTKQSKSTPNYIHPFESQLREKGFLHISKVKNGNDANWVLSIIIKHILYCSPDDTMKQLRCNFPQNYANPPCITLQDEHIACITNLPTKAFSLPLDLPFVFLLLPSRAIVAEKELYFTSRYNDVLSVMSMTSPASYSTFLRSYSSLSNGTVTHLTPKLLLSTPEAFLRLLSRFFNLGELLSRGNISQLPTQYLFQRYRTSELKLLDGARFISLLQESILNSCRVILDEAHERSVYLDVVLMTVSKLQHIKSFQPNTPPRLHQHMFTIMSATPDPDVYATLLEQYTETVTLTTRLLYDVKTKQIKATQARTINSELVPVETVKMLNSVMSARYQGTNDSTAVPPGDCLIFMAGQQECQTVLVDICTKLRQSAASNDIHVNYIILQTSFDGIETIEQFYNALLAEINTHDAQIEPTFILPLALTGKVAQLQKDVACAKLPSTVAKYRAFRHVFKILAATNSVESSVTIDGLTMLVDSGLHKENVFDVDKGVSTLTLKSITEDSRTQRKGRVGRTQQASVVQIMFEQSQPSNAATINNTNERKPSSNHALPELFSTDPAAIVIQLRLMGILLEQINEYLPTPLPQNNLTTILNDLHILDLITNDGLTPDGKLVAKLTSSFQPLYAATLIREFKINPNRGYVAAFVLIAMTSFADGLYFNQSSAFYSNIITDQHSNLVTLVSALLTTLATKRKDAHHLTFIGIDEKSFKSAQLNFSTVCAAFSEIQTNAVRVGRSSARIETAPIIKSVCQFIGLPRFRNESHISNLISEASIEKCHQQFLISAFLNLPERSSIHNRVDHVLRTVDDSLEQSWLPSREFAFHSFNSTTGFAKYIATDIESTLPSETRVYPFRGANSELFKFPTRAYFLNKSVNASFAQPFMILSTYHTYGNILNINPTQSSNMELTKYRQDIAHASHPDQLTDGLYNSIFAPSVFSLPLHDAFFTSPFSEILLDIFLGKRLVEKINFVSKKSFTIPEKSYKIELKSDLSRSKQKIQPQKQHVKKNATPTNLNLFTHTTLTIFSQPLQPRSYIEIGSIINRVRTLSPYFTQDVIFQRDDNFFVHYQNSFYSSPQHTKSYQVRSGLALTQKSLFCSSNQVYQQHFVTQKEISPPPTIYPITQATLAFHEHCIATNDHANFYPVIIIPTSHFFNFFDHEKRLATPLTIDNTRVDYRALTPDDKYILPSINSTAFTNYQNVNANSNKDNTIFIAYVSTNGPLLNLIESPVHWSQLDSTTHSTKFNKLQLSGYHHTRIPLLIVEEQCNLQYWAYPLRTPLYAVSNSTFNSAFDSSNSVQFNNVGDYYEAEKHRLDSIFTSFSRSSTLFPWPPTEYHSFLAPNPDIFNQFPNQARYLAQVQSSSNKVQLSYFYPKNHEKGFFKIIDSFRQNYKDYFIGIKTQEISGCKQAFALVSASKIGKMLPADNKSCLKLPDAPISAGTIKNPVETMSSPQPLLGVIRIRVSNPLVPSRKSSTIALHSESLLQQFKDNIEKIVQVLSPLVLHHKFSTDKNAVSFAEIDFVDRTILPWFIHCYAILFGIDLSPQKATQLNYFSPLQLSNLQLPFHEIHLTPESTSEPEDDVELDPVLAAMMGADAGDNAEPLTNQQLLEIFQQSTHCQQLYNTALSNFFTPFKSPSMSTIWAQRSLVTLTPIFFSLKLPIYLTPTISDNAPQFEVVLRSAQLPSHILPSGHIFSQVSTLSKLLDLYSNNPTAHEITHPVLTQHQNKDNQVLFSNDRYKALSTTIRPLLGSQLCLTLDDISIPVIYSNVFMVVFARHPYDHIENLHSLYKKSGNTLSKTISAEINSRNITNSSTLIPFEVHFGSQQDAYCMKSLARSPAPMKNNTTNDDDEFFDLQDDYDVPSQQPYQYTDIIEQKISDIHFPSTDQQFPSTTAITRLFHINRAMRYLSPQEIYDLALDEDLGDSETDSSSDDESQSPSSGITSLQIDTIQKVHPNIYRDFSFLEEKKYFRLVPLVQDFMTWYHSSFSSSSNIQQIPSPEDLLKKYKIERFEDDQRWVTNFEGYFDVLHSNNFLSTSTTSTTSATSTTNAKITKGFHIVSLSKDIDPVIIYNLVKNTEFWCKNATTINSSIIRYSAPIRDKLIRLCKRHPEFEESFHSIGEHLYIAYNSQYDSQIINILTQLETKSKDNEDFVNSEIDVDALYSSGYKSAYKTLSQIGLIANNSWNLLTSGPQGENQIQQICNNMLDKDLPHRFPHLLPQSDDVTTHTFMCFECGSSIHVRAPIYTQTHKVEHHILSGLLPLDPTINSSLLSNLHTTPYIILPSSTLCFTCISNGLKDQINFISISPQNILKINDFPGDFLDRFTDLFSILTFEQTQSNSASLYFPIGALILTIFDAINKGLSNSNQNSVKFAQQQHGKKSLQQTLDPFFASLSSSFQTYLCSKVHTSFLTSTKQITDSPLFISCPNHPFRYFHPATKSHICNVVLPNGARCDFRLCGDCTTYHSELNCPRSLFRKEVATIRNFFTEKTPCCGQVFSFDGCCAVSCTCGQSFCALCLESTGSDAHPHVRICILNPSLGSYGCSEPRRLQIVFQNVLRPRIISAFKNMDLQTRTGAYNEIERQHFESKSLDQYKPFSLSVHFKISLKDIQ